MAITEQTRHRLYQRLEQVLGRDEATVLMEHLPPVGWADVSTKRDIDHLAVATKRDLDHVERVLRADLTREVERAQRRVLTAMLGGMVTLFAGQTATFVAIATGS